MSEGLSENELSRSFETHFEMAERIGCSPEIIRAQALNFELGNFGSSRGVIYFPNEGKDRDDFAREIVLGRYSNYTLHAG